MVEQSAVLQSLSLLSQGNTRRFWVVEPLLHGCPDLAEVAGLEDVFLHREVLGVLDVAPPAPGGRRRQVGLNPSNLLEVQPGLLLLGPGVLEPDLHHALGQPDVVAEALTLRHCGRLVVLEDALHYLDLHVGHVGSEALVTAVPLSVGLIVTTGDVGLAVSVKVGAEASDLLGGGVFAAAEVLLPGVAVPVVLRPVAAVVQVCRGGPQVQSLSGLGARWSALELVHVALHGVLVELPHGGLQVVGGGGGGGGGGRDQWGKQICCFW